MKKLLILLILLMLPVMVMADLTGTEGLAIDLSSAGAGTDFTIAFDPTELLGSRTWGDASTDTIVWTFNRATGTDVTLTFNSGSLALQALTLTTDLAVAEGGTGASSFTDGYVLLGSGASAFTPLAVVTDGLIIIGDGAGDPTTLDVGSSTAITILGTIATGVWEGTAIADGYVPNNITIDLATLATTLTITDNEATAENNPIVFVAGADPDGGNLGLESDGTTHYNPSTGTITATEFVGGGSGITGLSVTYENIGDPGGAGSISFDDTETAIYTTAQDTAGSFFSLVNSNADVSNQVYMLDLDYSADTTQDNADFIRLQDAGSTLIVFEEEGKITMTPSGVDDATIISMVPSTALTQADVAWYGIKIDGAALDPGAVDNRIFGVAVDLSGVDLTNDPYVRALDLKMPNGGVALDIEEGEIHQDFTTGSDAGAEYTAIDVVIHAETLNAASTTHAIDIALSAGDPAGDVYALGTHSFIGPVKQSIGVYTTQDNLELQGRKTGGGASWADDVDGQECFVANADEVYLGDDAATGAQFNEIQVIMGTPGTRSINPTFWYNTAADLWTEFFPADDTLGFQQSGLIRWTLGDISGLWTNNGDPGVGESTAGWWIKIIRNEAPDPGTPTPTTAKTGVITDCTWSKTGALNVVSVEAGTITEGGNAVWNASETDIIDSAHYIAASIDNEHLADNAVDSAEINTNAVKLDALDVSDVSDNIAGDIAEGELADAIIVDADIKDDTIQEAALDCTAGPTDNYILSYDSGTTGFTWVVDATGGTTAYDDIGDPDAASSITFDDGETITWATSEDSAASFFTINDSDAALAANTYLMHLIYSVDDNEANADYFKCEDAGGVVFTIQEYGDFGGTGDMLLDSGAADSPIIKLVNANDDEFKMQLETASNIAFQIFGDTGDKFHFHLEDRGAGTGANNDITGFVVKMETETNNTLEEVSEIRTNLTDATATTTDATMEFYTAVGSSLTKSITLTGADVAVAGALAVTGAITENSNAVISEAVATGAIIFGDSTPDADGEMAFDTTGDGSTVTAGVLDIHDGTEVVHYFGSAGYPGADNHILKYDAGTNKVVWEADADTGGATAWDDIGNSDSGAAKTISFDDGEVVIFSTAEDSAISFFNIDNTDAALAANVYLLDLEYSVDDGEANADYLKCQDAGGVHLTIQQNGDLTTTGFLQTALATIDTTASYKGVISDLTKTAGATDEADDFFGVHSSMEMNDADSTIGELMGVYGQALVTSGTLGDGQEDAIGVQGEVKIDGGTAADDIVGLSAYIDGNAGSVTDVVFGLHVEVDLESAMTTIGSDVMGIYAFVDADENPTGSVYMLYLDEATGIDYGIYQNGTAANLLGGALNVVGAVTVGTATSVAGNLSLYDAGTLTIYEDGDNFNVTLACNSGEAVATLTGGLDITGVLSTSSNIASEPKHLMFNIFDPLAVQTLDTQICIIPLTSAALTITNIKITLDASGNEIAGDLKYADTFIGLANPVVINICDTSSGVLNDSAMGTAAVPATKCIYFQFDSAPHTDITQMSWDITYDYD